MTATIQEPVTMPDTLTDTDPDRARAHYPVSVPADNLTPAQEEALARIGAAEQKVADAERALEDARTARTEAIREAWPTIGPLGPSRIAREAGHGLGEGTVRGATVDLRAQDRARARAE